ncbi:osmotically inducible protein OsmC [Bacillaceae bacterium SIJ1]|uniref:OsmC family protein n=1 Tax=Litoribacterium kuwaitense TaxID=1398745 RepID=UPI0013E9FB0D|nr:OsmC family protein [Litoribacterium kuwaitense]NGP46812.1 osmotically inducible protein OsmC [Litoribacterium kuwaitense]
MSTNDVQTSWTNGTKGSGVLKTEGIDTNIAIPAALGGSGNGANPKEILVSAANACYTATLVYMLERREIPVEELTINSDVSSSKDEFKIIHYPHVVLAADATEEQAETANRLFEAADKGCDIGNMLRKADVQFAIEGKVTTK